MPNTAPQPSTLADLEAYVSSPVYTPTGAAALAAQIPQLREKATGAPGEHIAPGITRIRGNLCNVHGRYGPCDKALSGKKPAKGRKPRAVAKPKKVALTPEQRQQARDAEHAQNQANTLTKLNIAPDGQAALAALRNGDQPDPAAVARGGFEDAGLVERAQDGSYRLTASGRAALSASQSGDAGRAGSTISSARDRVAARRTRQQAAADRKQQAQAKRDARLAKQGKKPRAETPATTGTPKRASTPTRRAMPRAGAHVQAPKGTATATPAPPAPKQVAPALRDAAAKLSDGTASDEQVQTLVRNGLAKLNKDGQPVLTAAGLRATEKEKSWTSAHRVIAQWEQSIEQWVPADPPAESFTVFKDHTGAHRWIARTTTAYRDRDGEIISVKALEADAARMTATGQYGPLRWYHVGNPDPFNPVAPWGPGLDIGDCDFSIVIGRTSIECGTFKSAAIGEAYAASASEFELSPGFFHPMDQPDVAGVYEDIRRFERSTVPVKYGRASNLFTGLTVKEHRMDQATYEQRVKTYLDFAREKGISPEVAAATLAQAQQSDKAADAQGVAFKAAEPGAPPDLVINGVTYKAFPPKVDDPADEPEVKADALPVDDTTIVDDELPEEDTGGLTLSPEDIDAIRAAVGQAVSGAITQAIAPLMGLLDIEKKMQGHVQTMMQPFAQKDAAQAVMATQVAALTEEVATLKGDAPAVPYRASTAQDNVLTDLALLATAKSQQQPGVGPWDDIIQGLGLTRPSA